MTTRTDRIAIVCEDLGDWGDAQLRSEYDPDGPVIRINARIVRSLEPQAAKEFIAACIAHELYHHKEAIGATPRLASRRAREAAAQA